MASKEFLDRTRERIPESKFTKNALDFPDVSSDRALDVDSLYTKKAYATDGRSKAEEAWDVPRGFLMLLLHPVARC